MDIFSLIQKKKKLSLLQIVKILKFIAQYCNNYQPKGQSIQDENKYLLSIFVIITIISYVAIPYVFCLYRQNCHYICLRHINIIDRKNNVIIMMMTQ